MDWWLYLLAVVEAGLIYICLVRNTEVFLYRRRLLKSLSLKPSSEARVLLDFLEGVPFYLMVFSFWIPIKKFYENWTKETKNVQKD
jgi:hypothetical protein